MQSGLGRMREWGNEGARGWGIESTQADKNVKLNVKMRKGEGVKISCELIRKREQKYKNESGS